MKRGVIVKNIVSLYREPSSESERETQLILGQEVAVLEEPDSPEGWAFVRCFDGCEAWMENRWFRQTTPGEPKYAGSGEIAVVRSLIADIYESPEPQAGIITKATVSTELEVIRSQGRMIAVMLPERAKGSLAFIAASDVLLIDKNENALPLPPSEDEIISEAKRYIGVPYLWGGTTPFGIDCSGFVQLVYRINGIILPRNSSQQAVDSRMEEIVAGDLRPGDLVFFGKKEQSKRKISHVGISLGGDNFIHSAWEIGVTISSLKDEKYKRIFAFGKRLVF